MLHLPLAFLGVSSVHAVGQALVDGVVSGGRYAIVGVSIGLIFGTTGRFHFAFATTFTLCAYVASILAGAAGLPWPIATLAGVMAAAALGVIVEAAIYRPIELRAPGDPALAVFVASLGVTIVGENVIRLIWSSNSRNVNGFASHPFRVAGVTVTTMDLVVVGTAIAVAVAFSGVMRYTRLGRQIKATRADPDLASTVGVRVRRVILQVFAIGSAAGGLGAVLDGMKFAVVPDMGTTPLLYGMVVAFLAGTRSDPIIVALAGLLVGVVQSLSTLWVSDQLSIVAVFGVLIVFLSYRSLTIGFARYSGSPLRVLARILIPSGRREVTERAGGR